MASLRRRRGWRVRDKVVAKEQGITLVESPRLTNVDVDAALPVRLHEEEFRPVALGGVAGAKRREAKGSTSAALWPPSRLPG